MNYISMIAGLSRKELKDSFSSPFIYVLAGLFSLIMGWLFFNYLIISKEFTQASLTQTVLKPIFGNINFVFLFFSPLLTMGSFAEEKKLGTLDLLTRSKLSFVQIIIAKFINAFMQSIFLISLTLIFPIILSFSGYNDIGVIFSSYIGIIGSICCYLAVGIFCSTLTENQIIAAVCSFCILLSITLIILSANATNNQLLIQMVSYLSIPYHFEAFSRGSIKSYSFVYYISFISGLFYCAHKSLESRKW